MSVDSASGFTTYSDDEDLVTVSRIGLPLQDRNGSLVGEDLDFEVITSGDALHSSGNGLPSATREYEFSNDPA